MGYNSKKDYEWFKSNQATLFREHPNKYLVIRDQKVVCAYTDMEEAVSKSGLPLGEYVLQLCLEGPEAYTIQIHSPGRVAL